MSVSTPPPRQQSSGDPRLDRRLAYAQSFVAEGDLPAAMDLLQQTLEEAPHWTAAWMALGAAAERLGDRTEAARAFKAAVACDPEGLHGASLHLARVMEARSAPVMPARYVAALFDDYAPRFERHLVEGLGYTAPAVLVAALAAAGLAGPFGRAMDLGCGTGLMGRAIRPLVGWLAGVDLSPAMVAAAAATGLYDELAVGDIVAALEERPAAGLELVLAADVLVYCGALEGVLAAVVRALAPGGVLAFTAQAGTEPVRLGDDMRFSHSPSYLRDALEGAGLDLLRLDATSTRREAGHPVPGLVAVARRP